jgi:hypothetical protein
MQNIKYSCFVPIFIQYAHINKATIPGFVLLTDITVTIAMAVPEIITLNVKVIQEIGRIYNNK